MLNAARSGETLLSMSGQHRRDAQRRTATSVPKTALPPFLVETVNIAGADPGLFHAFGRTRSWRCSSGRRRRDQRANGWASAPAWLPLGAASSTRSAGTSPNAGPMAPQSIDAQLDVQPTPTSVRRAEQKAQATFAATLARAKRLDAQGNRAGCTRALAAARRMYNL